MSEYITTVTDSHTIVELQPAPPVVQEVSWLISIGAFFDRFGEYAIPILADSNPMIQAFVKYISPRPYINLQRADLPGGLDLLISNGHLIDKSAILNTPCRPGEEP